MSNGDQNIQNNHEGEEPETPNILNEKISQEQPIESTGTLNQNTNIPQSEIQNMEVAKHPHHVMQKKNWKEYFLEFFMLFLAVFLGFIAENARQHLVENKQAKEYMHGLIDDIKANNVNALLVINDFQNRLPHLDSMISSFGDLMKGHSEKFTRNMKYIGDYKDFYITDGTMQQLKNAGGLRLIKNTGIADSILHYDGITKVLLIHKNFLDNNILIPLWHLQGTLIDSYKLDSLHDVLHQPSSNFYPGDILLTHDRQKLVQYYSDLSSLKLNFTSWIYYLSDFKNKGADLIALLQKEYQIK